MPATGTHLPSLDVGLDIALVCSRNKGRGHPQQQVSARLTSTQQQQTCVCRSGAIPYLGNPWWVFDQACSGWWAVIWLHLRSLSVLLISWLLLW